MECHKRRTSSILLLLLPLLVAAKAPHFWHFFGACWHVAWTKKHFKAWYCCSQYRCCCCCHSAYATVGALIVWHVSGGCWHVAWTKAHSLPSTAASVAARIAASVAVVAAVAMHNHMLWLLQILLTVWHVSGGCWHVALTNVHDIVALSNT
jgi:hypothetical protein